MGMHKVAPRAWRLMKAGLVGSQAVYPRASKVQRSPPEGKLEASGSPMIRFFPEKDMIAWAMPVLSRKASCFSAVPPVRGWNQWVKWVAPRDMAHSFMAWATSPAMAGSSGAPRVMVERSFSAVLLGRYCRMAAALKTSSP